MTKYKIDDYVQVKFNGGKTWGWITDINFLNPTTLEYTLSFEPPHIPNKAKIKVLEKDIFKLQTSL